MVSNSDNNSVNFKPISNKANPLLLGHKSNEADFLSAFKSGNFHHAWLLVGDKGVGKATFAYRVARFIFATSPEPENKPMEFWTPVKRVKKSKSAAVKESSVKSENQDDMLFDLDDNDKSSSLDFDLSDDLELSSDDENIDNENNFYDDADDLHFNNQSESYLNEKRLNASSLQIDANDKIFDQIILRTFPDLKVVEPNYEAGKSVIPIEDIINLKEFFLQLSFVIIKGSVISSFSIYTSFMFLGLSILELSSVNERLTKLLKNKLSGFPITIAEFELSL